MQVQAVENMRKDRLSMIEASKHAAPSGLPMIPAPDAGAGGATDSDSDDPDVADGTEMRVRPSSREGTLGTC